MSYVDNIEIKQSVANFYEYFKLAWIIHKPRLLQSQIFMNTSSLSYFVLNPLNMTPAEALDLAPQLKVAADLLIR